MKHAPTTHILRPLLASAAGFALVAGFATPAVAEPADGQSEHQSSEHQPLTATDQTPQAQGLPTEVLPTSTAVPESKIAPRLANASGEVSVYVQFTGTGAFEATQPQAVRDGLREPLSRISEVQALRSSVASAAQSAAANANATPIYTTTNLLPGVALRGDAAALRALADQPNVVAITPLVPKSVQNKAVDKDTRALNSWVSLKETGDGVKIAVIDTGIDYTHAALGGPGTRQAFEDARSSKNMPPASSGLYDPKKFVGGYDLVGDDYNPDPSSPSYSPNPQPDTNPLDCNGHGSHVAGTAAGYGVGEDGKTFRGDYGSLSSDQLAKMKIGPGSAPKAQIYGLRIFGCGGTSNVLGQALDRALDPNGDGDFSDKADVVNMSLVSLFAPSDDPDNALVDKLTQNNVVSVVASGNDGDIYDIGGSPANARSSIAVANSISSSNVMSRVDYDAGNGDTGQIGGLYSNAFRYAGVSRDRLRGSVVPAPSNNAFGCRAFAANSLRDRWVMISLKSTAEAEQPCGTSVSFDNAANAGAQGVVVVFPADGFIGTLAGNSRIPGVMIQKSSGDKLRPAAEQGRLTVQLDPNYIGVKDTPTNSLDVLNPSSSRNAHGSNGIIKPDVTAAGTLISSISVGSGNGSFLSTGTSMATPHVAGIAALVRHRFPNLNANQVKARIMNTANRDVTTSGGTVYGPNRVGAGRVDALDALTSDASAWSSDDPAGTSVNFGIVEVGEQAVRATRPVLVRNTGSQARTFSVGYTPSSSVPGVEYSVPSSVTVGANSSATVQVTMSIANPAQVKKSRDPSLAAVQGGLPRQYIAQAAGRLTLKADNQPQLRLPVYSSVKLSSALSAGPVRFDGNKDTLIRLSGRGNPDDSGFKARVAAFELGATSPRQSAAQLPQRHQTDLQYVGANTSVPAVIDAGRDPATAMLNFGISTWANLPVLGGSNSFDVEIDTNNDGTADFVTLLTRQAGVDLPVASTFRAVDGIPRGAPLATLPVNGAQGNIDTNTMDTNAFTMPVPASVLGLNLRQSAPVKYRVTTSNYFGTSGDSTGWISWNVTQPVFASGNSTGDVIYDGVAGTGLPGQHRSSAQGRALFIYLHNSTGDLSGSNERATGNKTQIAPLEVARPSIPAASSVVAIGRDANLYQYPAPGNGALGQRTHIGSGWGNVTSLSVVDWNADGVLDVVSTWRNGDLTVHIGRSAGGFDPMRVLARNFTSPAVATQWTRTGGPGVMSIASNGQLRYWPNNNGQLGSARTIGNGWQNFELTPTDWDRDGSMDIVARTPNGQMRVYRSNGNGDFLHESRPVVGNGWNVMSAIVARGGIDSATSNSVLAVDEQGRLRNYPVVNRAFGTMKVIGNGWDGYRLAE